MTKKSKSSKKSTKTSKIKVTDNELKLYDVICAYRNEWLNMQSELTTLECHIRDITKNDYRIALRRPESAKQVLFGLMTRISGLRDANECLMIDAIDYLGKPYFNALADACGNRERANEPEAQLEKHFKEYILKEAKKLGLKLCACEEPKDTPKVTK